MRPFYLLDTCIISEPVKPFPIQSIVENIQSKQQMCAISSVTWHELLYGVSRLEKSKKKQLLHEYLMDVIAPSYKIIDYDEHSAWIHAEIRTDCENGGFNIGFADGQIAAIAKANNMILITKNKKHFEPINGINMEDWCPQIEND